MKRIGIVGAGRFGSALAESLVRRGAEVILLDCDRDAIQRMATIVTKAVQGDGTDASVLISTGFQACDTAVVAIEENMESSILISMNLKEIGVPNVVAKAGTSTHGRVLERVGVDLLVFPNQERAQRLARSLMTSSAVDYFEVAKGISVVEVKAPEQFLGKTLAETNMRKELGITVLIIKRRDPRTNKETHIVSPSADDEILEGDILLVFGPDKKLQSLA